MWLDMVEFRSASSEIRGQKIKKERKKKEEESLVKYKSADNYVGRPKGLKRRQTPTDAEPTDYDR